MSKSIAIEARIALQLTEEIKELDERTAELLKLAGPKGILTSAPGVAQITAAAILGRLGDPTRFTSLAGARAFTGLVPALDASGLSGRHGGPTVVDKPADPGVLVHRADGPTGTMLFLHNLAEEPATLDLGELAGEVDHPNQVFGNRPHDEPLDLSTLELDGYGYRWIRLHRAP